MALITHLFNAGKGEQRERVEGRDARNGRSVNTADEWEDPEETRRDEKRRKKEVATKILDTKGQRKETGEINDKSH